VPRPPATPPPQRAAGGAAAEALAIEHLQALGYEILARNVRRGGGEIDIVAREGEVLCFVEVRSLNDPAHGDPLESIGPQKIRRVVSAARAYLDELPTPWPPMRFDAVGVLLTTPPQIRLVRDAFEA
jgi:putative endonuclease